MACCRATCTTRGRSCTTSEAAESPKQLDPKWRGARANLENAAAGQAAWRQRIGNLAGHSPAEREGRRREGLPHAAGLCGTARRRPAPPHRGRQVRKSRGDGRSVEETRERDERVRRPGVKEPGGIGGRSVAATCRPQKTQRHGESHRRRSAARSASQATASCDAVRVRPPRAVNTPRSIAAVSAAVCQYRAERLEDARRIGSGHDGMLLSPAFMLRASACPKQPRSCP